MPVSTEVKLQKRELLKTKKFTRQIVLAYVSLYTDVEEMTKFLEEFKDVVKARMLKTMKKGKKSETVEIPGCPFMLETIISPTTNVNREKVVKTLAKKLYGKSYKSAPAFKDLVRRNTKKGTTERLLAPKPNPKFKEKK